jgi:endo-1,4-beta-xylanase
MYKLVAGMVKQGVPIDGVGFQCHIDAASEREWGHPEPTALRTNIQRYAALGLTVNVSEMDVRTAKLKQ